MGGTDIHTGSMDTATRTMDTHTKQSTTLTHITLLLRIMGTTTDTQKSKWGTLCPTLQLWLSCGGWWSSTADKLQTSDLREPGNSKL
mmetsp:Transcript_3336/g.6904  ORF Transcript_3336/g.6904 Transcript_3336/m.6904 type:complete len:87 (+) Transcript_3336:766-1026(+)